MFSLYRFFYLHGVNVGNRDKMSKKNYSGVQAKFALQPSFAEKPWGRAQPQLVSHYPGSARVFGYTVYRGFLNRVYGILQLKVYHFL